MKSDISIYQYQCAKGKMKISVGSDKTGKHERKSRAQGNAGTRTFSIQVPHDAYDSCNHNEMLTLSTLAPVERSIAQQPKRGESALAGWVSGLSSAFVEFCLTWVDDTGERGVYGS